MNQNSKKIIYFIDLGIKSYQDTLNFQEKLMNEIIRVKLCNKNFSYKNKKEIRSYLLFVEHPHVYTLGKSGNKKNLLANSEKLKQIRSEFFHTNRGGDITYHGFGQLVGYPILDLEQFKPDIRWYLRNLEEIIIKTLADYTISSMRSKGETGVWLDVSTPHVRKICSLGVRISRWVTMHGFALNVNTDLNYFKHIIPCGIKDKQVTSMKQELKTHLDLKEVKTKVKYYFQEVFEIQHIQEF